MEAGQLVAHRGSQLVNRENLIQIATPDATATHKPVPHHEVVDALHEALSFRHIGVTDQAYAVSTDGMKLFAVLDLETQFDGCRFALGMRNSHDKSMRLALTVGYRVFVCDNLAFHGEFTPVLAKHTRRFSLTDALAIGLDRMQRNFNPMRRQVQAWKEQQLSGDAARMIIYAAFVEGRLDAPRHLARLVHHAYFDANVPEFASRTMWSLSNAFTATLKQLEPVARFRATAKLADFLQSVEHS